MQKKNCWEFMKCGREPGGKNVKELGVCPATIEIRVDGIHDGKNAGRCCWAIAGTFCKGKPQGTFVDKFKDCMECDFFKIVSQEEDRLIISIDIHKIIEKST